jgi:hypothetical protein
MDSCVLQAAPTMVFCMNTASVETGAHVFEALQMQRKLHTEDQHNERLFSF